MKVDLNESLEKLYFANNKSNRTINETVDDYGFDYYGAAIELGRDIVYDFVYDEKSAHKFYDSFTKTYQLESLESLALEGLINNALVAANEHEAAMDWMDHILWKYIYDMPDSETTKIESFYNSLKTKKAKLDVLLDCLNSMALDGLVTQSL